MQTFPDGLAFDCGRSDIQRMLGNAVPSLVAEVLGRAIREQLLEKPVRERKLQLLPPRRPGIPKAEAIAEVPAAYRSLVGNHPEHPGTGRGNRARQRLAARAGLASTQASLGALVGHVERIECGILEGWAMDSASPDTPVELLVETPLGRRRTLANAWRGYLHRAGIGSARHGFRIPLGPRATVVTVRRAGDGAELRWLQA